MYYLLLFISSLRVRSSFLLGTLGTKAKNGPGDVKNAVFCPQGPLGTPGDSAEDNRPDHDSRPMPAYSYCFCRLPEKLAICLSRLWTWG